MGQNTNSCLGITIEQIPENLRKAHYHFWQLFDWFTVCSRGGMFHKLSLSIVTVLQNVCEQREMNVADQKVLTYWVGSGGPLLIRLLIKKWPLASQSKLFKHCIVRRKLRIRGSEKLIASEYGISSCHEA